MYKPGMRPAQYGFGWFNKMFKYSPIDSVASHFHLGMTKGFLSFMVHIPSLNSTIVILCNSSPTDFFGITGNLAKVLYNKSVQLKQPVHKVIEKMIVDKGATKAIEAYKVMKTDTAHYYIDWISMNFLADQLRTLKMYEDARIIAENNVAEFQNRDLVMVTMGNIYLALNKKKDAITYFKKAILIYPENEEAKNRLKEIEGN